MVMKMYSVCQAIWWRSPSRLVIIWGVCLIWVQSPIHPLPVEQELFNTTINPQWYSRGVSWAAALWTDRLAWHWTTVRGSSPVTRVRPDYSVKGTSYVDLGQQHYLQEERHSPEQWQVDVSLSSHSSSTGIREIASLNKSDPNIISISKVLEVSAYVVSQLQAYYTSKTNYICVYHSISS